MTDSTPLPPLTLRAWLRYDVVARSLDRLHPATVLEIGCGQGAFGARVAGRTAYLGLEPDPESYAVAAERISAHGGQVKQATTRELDPGKGYDLVCAFEVLEHIEDDRAALLDWVRFIRPGGHLVISVPADPSRFGPMDERVGHFRRYSVERLESLVRECGLVEVSTTVYGWPLGYALEAVHNWRESRRPSAPAEASMAERTASSGRLIQPTKRATGLAIAAATVPFRGLQRLRPTAGIGLVLQARRPAVSEV